MIRAIRTMGHLLFSYQAYGMRLIADGKPIVERAVMSTVANTHRKGSAVPIAPAAKVTDGKLDVVIIGDLRRVELVPYFRAVLAKQHLNLLQVTSLRAKQVPKETCHPMRVHCDDQNVGRTPVTILAEP